MECREYLAWKNLGLMNLQRLGLGVETEPPSEKALPNPPFVGLIDVCHAPFRYSSEKRLNVADPDNGFRLLSMRVLKKSFVEASSLGAKKVVIHSAPKIFREQTGDYGILIRSLRKLADFAKERSLKVCLENNLRYWPCYLYQDARYINTPPEEMLETSVAGDLYFGTAPEEWAGIAGDVDRSNFFLTLDTSHAVSYTMETSDLEARKQILARFLDHKGRIDHVHWSDNYITDNRGRLDSHMPLAEGTIPREFHRKVKNLDATKTLEFLPVYEVVKKSLEYIEYL
ncbi:MAG: sugar phosphate isomerase/epimerase family protein [Candidatus Bathyarchaeia archaeon]